MTYIKRVIGTFILHHIKNFILATVEHRSRLALHAVVDVTFAQVHAVFIFSSKDKWDSITMGNADQVISFRILGNQTEISSFGNSKLSAV